MIKSKHKALTANNKLNIGFKKMRLERKRQMNMFEKALKETISQEEVLTENGAVGFKSSGHALLDINFATSSHRNKSECEIQKMFSEAYQENPLLAVKWLFMLRDIRGNGMGERRSFRVCFRWLATVRKDLILKLIPLVAEYGRWDDLFCLIDKSATIDAEVEAAVFDAIDKQWAEDLTNMKAEKPISLLAKWLPSINTSSSKSVALAKRFCKYLQLSEKQYRKTLSSMRKYLNVIEQKMSAKQWSEINYEAVPSKANVKYNAAFLRNDEARRREFLGKLEKGEAKINSSANFPCDIVHAYAGKVGYSYYSRSTRCTIDPALEAMWKALPDIAVNGNVLAIADGSGSMTCRASNGSNMTALEVANALAIYCAEHCTGPFNNKYITFSSRPQYVDMSNAKSLAEKIGIALEHNECANTNIEATFDLVLQTAVDHNLKQKDIPTLVIISDMEIDAGADMGDGYSYWNRPSNYSAHKTALMEKIRQKWAAHNLILPRTIWWNVNNRTGTIPLTQNPETGIILCSGYSQGQFKMIASNKTDPYEVLVEALNVERYAPIEAAIKDLISN